MSVDNPKVIDIIGTERNGIGVTLTITDHLEWGDSNHLMLLQEKLNSYLAFMESGEIFEEYPSAKGKKLKVSVVCKHEPDEEGRKFLSKCKAILEKAGFGFNYEFSKI